MRTNKYINLIREKGTAFKVEKRKLTETCIALEEVLLNYQEHFGTDGEVSLKYAKKYDGNFTVKIDIAGKSYNPLDTKETEGNFFVLNSLNLKPQYSYSSGINRVAVSLKVNDGAKELKTILFSVCIGILLDIFGEFLPGNFMNVGLIIINAISNAIFGLMKMATMPVIFLCVVRNFQN